MRYANTLSVYQLAGLPAPCRARGGADGQTGGAVRTPRSVPARPGRAGQSSSDAGRAGHNGGSAPEPLRLAEPGWEERCNCALARWNATPAAHVNDKPFARPVGLALPEWGANVPARISVDFDADATTGEYTAAEQKRLANLCEVLIQTGILSPLDWAGALDLSVTAALGQFVNEKMGCGDLRRLSFVSFRWTTDLENGSCREESGNAESLVWQQAFAPGMAVGKPIGGFSLRGDGTTFEPVSLERWGRHLESTLGKDTAADCIGVLVQMVSYLGGWTPAWAYDKAEEDVDSYEEIEGDENDDDPGYDTHERNAKESFAWFKEVIPDYARSYSFDIPRMEKAAARAKHKKLPCAHMVEASLRCARYMEIIRDNNPFSENALCHLGSGWGQGYPPVLVFWQNEPDAASDPCVHIYDDWGEFMMEQGSDLIWLHGWDTENAGDAKTPGTIRRAVYSLALTLGLVALLDKLIEMWETAVPTTRAQPLVQIFAHEDAAKAAKSALQIAEGMLPCK